MQNLKDIMIRDADRGKVPNQTNLCEHRIRIPNCSTFNNIGQSTREGNKAYQRALNKMSGHSTNNGKDEQTSKGKRSKEAKGSGT